VYKFILIKFIPNYSCKQ